MKKDFTWQDIRDGLTGAFGTSSRKICPNKILIVNDDDGHAYAFEYNAANMKACLQCLVVIKWDMEDPDGALELLAKPDATADKIWDFLTDWNGPCDRSGGGRLYVVEVQKEWNFRHRPFG